MKHFSLKARRHREAGAALITVLMVSLCTAMLLAASLTVAMTTQMLGYNQAYSQAAMELADAGVNSELQVVAQNISTATVSLKSSQPVVSAGVTVTLPGQSTPVLGRVGTVSGYTGGTYYVYSSNNAAGTVAWDGVTSPFYITCSANVNGCWQTVQIQSGTTSLFNVYGVYSGGDSSTSSTVTVGSGSNVTVTGAAGVNGTVSQGSSCSFTAPSCINANCGKHSSGQLTSGNCCSGGTLCSCQPPIVYPKTSDCCRNCFGCDPGASDATAYSTCQSHCCNSSCVYQYTSTAGDSGINTHNCCPLSGGCGTHLDNTCFSNANICPGTYNSDNWWWWENPTVAVQTLIFEPGDYYFTKMQLDYDASKQIVIDPCAYASGGTPGQVRFWCVDCNAGTDGATNDYCSLPITNTCAAGSSTPDPGQFRIYYDKDGCTCQFNRPDNITDWTGNTVQGDFNYYCGIYACSKPATDNSSKQGCCCGFCGTNNQHGCSTNSNNNHGCSHLCGSLLCDKMSFQGNCKCDYVPSKTCTKDPCSGGCAVSWSCSGG
jgi:Tfp pilus assembly protein PilX